MRALSVAILIGIILPGAADAQSIFDRQLDTMRHQHFHDGQTRIWHDRMMFTHRSRALDPATAEGRSSAVEAEIEKLCAETARMEAATAALEALGAEMSAHNQRLFDAIASGTPVEELAPSTDPVGGSDPVLDFYRELLGR